MPFSGINAAVCTGTACVSTTNLTLARLRGIAVALDATDGACTCKYRAALMATGVDPKCHHKYVTSSSLTAAQCTAVTDNSGVSS